MLCSLISHWLTSATWLEVPQPSSFDICLRLMPVACAKGRCQHDGGYRWGAADVGGHGRPASAAQRDMASRREATTWPGRSCSPAGRGRSTGCLLSRFVASVRSKHRMSTPYNDPFTFSAVQPPDIVRTWHMPMAGALALAGAALLLPRREALTASRRPRRGPQVMADFG